MLRPRRRFLATELPGPQRLDPVKAATYRRLREECGLTQVEVASLAKVKQSTISGRETMRQYVSPEAIGFLIWLKTLPRERLDALLEDPSNLED